MYKGIKSRIVTAKAVLNKITFHQQIGLVFKEETSKMLHLGYSFQRCSNFDTSESRSRIPGRFRNVVLEKDVDRLDRSCEKWRSVTKGQGGEKDSTNNKKKEG
jgi:hypothetical protein